eukprot:6931903-Pyramimonas_sp.AAC.1
MRSSASRFTPDLSPPVLKLSRDNVEDFVPTAVHLAVRVDPDRGTGEIRKVHNRAASSAHAVSCTSSMPHAREDG